MGNSITIPVGDSRIWTQQVYDEEDRGLALIGVHKVIMTVREEEDSADFLIQVVGTVEYEGIDETDPGVCAIEFKPEDTNDIPIGDYWYDIELLFLGHWFYQGTHSGRRFFYEYGQVGLPRTGKNPLWTEVDPGSVYLVDDDVNYIEVDLDGTMWATIDGFGGSSLEDSLPLYVVYVESGVIIQDFPGTTWFAEGSHSGLDFAYDAGKVMDDTYIIHSVGADTVTLEDDTTNYIEVSKEGVVSANQNGFTKDALPLYTVVTASGAISVVTKVDDVSFVVDLRTVWTRGDRVLTSSKERFYLVDGITKKAETVTLGG